MKNNEQSKIDRSLPHQPFRNGEVNSGMNKKIMFCRVFFQKKLHGLNRNTYICRDEKIIKHFKKIFINE